MYLETTFHNVVQLFVPRRAHLPELVIPSHLAAGGLAAMRSSPLHQGYQQQDDEHTRKRGATGVAEDEADAEGRGGTGDQQGGQHKRVKRT